MGHSSEGNKEHDVYHHKTIWNIIWVTGLDHRKMMCHKKMGGTDVDHHKLV